MRPTAVIWGRHWLHVQRGLTLQEGGLGPNYAKLGRLSLALILHYGTVKICTRKILEEDLTAAFNATPCTLRSTPGFSPPSDDIPS